MGFLEEGDFGESAPDPLHAQPIRPLTPSCLIAMALKNSKTGSLPVSEIYSFMKEHFPYFKVRPCPGCRCESCPGLRLRNQGCPLAPHPTPLRPFAGGKDTHVCRCTGDVGTSTGL